MSANNTNPLSVGQVEADLFMAEAAMNKADSLSAKMGWRKEIYYSFMGGARKVRFTFCGKDGHLEEVLLRDYGLER